jgi:hypothetical protein
MSPFLIDRGKSIRYSISNEGLVIGLTSTTLRSKQPFFSKSVACFYTNPYMRDFFLFFFETMIWISGTFFSIPITIWFRWYVPNDDIFPPLQGPNWQWESIWKMNSYFYLVNFLLRQHIPSPTSFSSNLARVNTFVPCLLSLNS